MKVLVAFCKQQFYVISAYKVAFWMTIVNTFVRIFAHSMLWMILYTQSPETMQVGLNQILIYSTASIALSQTFTWWDGPHQYVSAYVRNGKIIIDMFRPIEFEKLLFFRGSSQAILNFTIYTIPTFCISALFLKINIFTSLTNVFFALIAIILGYILLFMLNFFLAIISFHTFDLSGILHTYHGIVAFCSGQVVPLWFFPTTIANILGVLPFKGVFYIPLAIMIGEISGNGVLYALLFQICWIIIIFLAGRIFWNSTLKKVVVQGG